METLNQPKTGLWSKLTPNARRVLRTLGGAAGVYLLYLLLITVAPGWKLNASKTGNALGVDQTLINNESLAEKLELPSTELSDRVANLPKNIIWEYMWGANVAMITANGGPRTTKNSLMEQNKINLNIVRKDSFDDLQAGCLAFAAEFNSGNSNPIGEMSCMGVSIMGDGAKYFISTLNKMADDKFGKNKYHWVVKGCYGGSLGEDKLIGPAEWLSDPKTMIGKIIITTVGDKNAVSLV